MAEVLITLGIIGVVAALTMPTLIANYQKQKTVTQLKKAYSEIAQALKLAEAEYGNMDGWSYSNMITSEGIKDYVGFVKKYFLPYIKTTKFCTSEEFSSCSFDGTLKLLNTSEVMVASGRSVSYAITPSGYSILFWSGGGGVNFSDHLHFFVDINGPRQGTNTIGKDIFQMSANFGPQIANADTENRPKKSGFWMFGAGWEPALTRDELATESGRYACKSGNGRMCGALIQADGWEISPDYPW